MIRPFASIRSRRFLVRVLRRASIRLRRPSVHQVERILTRSFDPSAELWDALRTVGFSDIKIKVDLG